MSLNFDRQYKMFNPDTERIPIRIFGCGSIGSNLAYMLAKVGFNNIEVIDFDTVDEVNITPQMFELLDVGKLKIDATYQRIKRELNVEIKRVNGKIDEKTEFEPDEYLNVLAFDSLKARRVVYDKIKLFKTTFVDVRTGGKNFSIYVVNNAKDDKKFIDQYEKSLQKEESDLKCGEKTAFYINSSVCAEVTSQIIKIAKGKSYQRLVMRNLDSFEFVVNNKENTTNK